ncbi:hypothetical protein ACFVQ3_13630 [Oerskovia sp. NPDC057915]|uniref:hypothetical protein n=1 Tax=Oerskovia sp. NPDC057915 TaxID=3346280 RepID=UPI0036DE8090
MRRSCAPAPRHRTDHEQPLAITRDARRTTFEGRAQMADLAYILLTVVFFTAVGLVARRHGSSGGSSS